MSDDWTSPTGENERITIKIEVVDKIAPAEPEPDDVDPDTGISERDLNLLDAVYHELALDAADDPRPNDPEEDDDDAWLMARARERMAMSQADLGARRVRGQG